MARWWKVEGKEEEPFESDDVGLESLKTVRT